MGYQDDKKRFFGYFDKQTFNNFKNKAKSNGFYVSGKINKLLKKYIKEDQLLSLEYINRKSTKKVGKSIYLEKNLNKELDKIKDKYGLDKIIILETIMSEYVNNEEVIKKAKNFQEDKIQSSYKIDHDLYKEFSKKAKEAGFSVTEKFNIVISDYIENINLDKIARSTRITNLNFEKEKYNVYIDMKTKEDVNEISKKYNIEMSDIINFALFDYTNEN